MADFLGDLTGDCLGCHGPNTTYFEFPLPPSWNGAEHGSQVNTGFYFVLPGSLQDHTGRTANMCLNCHKVVK
jgi:mono/diheme cytochrome c family protein